MICRILIWPDEVLPRDGAAQQDCLNDSVGQGFHSLVARVTGDTIVREGSFRTGSVGRLASERAGIHEYGGSFLSRLPELLVLGGIRPKGTADHYQRMAFRQHAG